MQKSMPFWRLSPHGESALGAHGCSCPQSLSAPSPTNPPPGHFQISGACGVTIPQQAKDSSLSCLPPHPHIMPSPQCHLPWTAFQELPVPPAPCKACQCSVFPRCWSALTHRRVSLCFHQTMGISWAGLSFVLEEGSPAPSALGQVWGHQKCSLKE